MWFEENLYTNEAAFTTCFNSISTQDTKRMMLSEGSYLALLRLYFRRRFFATHTITTTNITITEMMKTTATTPATTGTRLKLLVPVESKLLIKT